MGYWQDKLIVYERDFAYPNGRRQRLRMSSVAASDLPAQTFAEYVSFCSCRIVVLAVALPEDAVFLLSIVVRRLLALRAAVPARQSTWRMSQVATKLGPANSMSIGS